MNHMNIVLRLCLLALLLSVTGVVAAQSPLLPKLLRESASETNTAQHAVLQKIPKVARIDKNRTRIDFLANTVAVPEKNTGNTIEKNTAQHGERIFLGSNVGRQFYYLGSSAQKLSTGEHNKTYDYLVSYNHKRGLIGLFHGFIDIVVHNAADVQQVASEYSADVYLSYKEYATLRLKDIGKVATVYDSLTDDARVKSVRLQIQEDNIVKH